MNNDPLLLGCPFCGCKDIEIFKPFYALQHEEWIARCENRACDVRLYVDGTKDQLIDKWNNRVEVVEKVND